MNNPTRLLLTAAVCVVLGACTRNVQEEAPAPTTTPPSTTQPTTGTTDGRFQPSDLDSDSCLRQRVVYFDFDRDNLRSEFQQIVNCHAKYLRDRSDARITLEGHADERGSREYNLGLGERRGNSVQQALQGAGGSANQINVVSYGEERPTCTSSGESCWSQNRRVEIIYTAR